MTDRPPEGAPRGLVQLSVSAPLFLLLLAAALRLWRLDLRPLHHDEGTNVIFLLRLLRDGVYEYDPANYHGPLLYVLSAVPLFLLGTTTVALRLVPALLGTALAAVPWLVRRELGRAGSLAAGVLLAVSPSLVYYSRDNIHEIYLVTLTLCLVTAAVRGATTGRRVHFILGGAAAGAMVATKETACLTFLALLAGLLLSGGAGLRRPDRAGILACLVTASLLSLLFYSDGFTELRALIRPLQALRLWGERGIRADGHGKPWWYYLGILARDESTLLIGGFAGAARALWKRDPFARFLAGWTGAILLFYSSIPYKTPWLILNIVLPLALLAGTVFAGQSGAGDTDHEGRRSRAGRWILWGLLVLGAAVSARRAYLLSFVQYDDDRASALVYVQTRRDVNRLMARIETFASSRPERRAVPIEILSPDYLPLNWYLRDFSDVSYYGKTIERPVAPVVIARSDTADDVEKSLGSGYVREQFALRPGVDLCLFLQEGDPGRL
jgi:uncharacterized protein (TIGR03663 family)